MWRAKLLEVERAADVATRDDTAPEPPLQRLVVLLDDSDPLVAYAAMRALEQQPPALAIRESAASDSDDASDSDEEVGRATKEKLLDVVLRHVDALRVTTLALVREPQTTPSQSSCVYELLSFVSELAEQLAKSVGPQCSSSVDALAAALMDAFADGDVDLAAQPTFVSSAAVACLHSLLRLLRRRPSVTTGALMVQQREWLRRLLLLVVGERSSLSRFALELLAQQRLEAHAPQDAFVSASSRFPFLQSWIAFASSAVLVLVEYRAMLQGDDLALVRTAVLRFPAERSYASAADTRVGSLPDRATLLAVLSEQDDVMVDALHTLLQLTLEGEACGEESGCPNDDGDDAGTVDVAADLQRYLSEQLDPDLLFADLLQTFGHDHLVLLDLLISSETAMLEYLLRYLRRLGANWEASRAALCRPSTRDSSSTSSGVDCEQKRQRPLDDVMGVLIRLRFEIDKQVAAEMFPYNPTPLLRRLLHIEELYDGV